MLGQFVPIVIFLALILLLTSTLLGLSFIAGPSKRHRSKLVTYESGIVPDTPGRQRFSVRFYLTAMLFIIFDVEAVFFYPWAVLLHQLRWYGLIEMFIFMGVLVVALAHIWKKGGFDWE